MPKMKKKMKSKKRFPAKETLKHRKTQKKSTSRAKKKVLAIPKGYNSVIPYLIVNNAAEALEFYKNVFGAKILLKMEQGGGKVGHAELQIGDSKIMLADEYPEMDARSPHSYGGSPVSMHLYIKNVDGVVERAVTSGARLVRPVSNMFYGDRSGMIEDPYGHKWNISTHVEDVPPRELKKRAEELFGNKS